MQKIDINKLIINFKQLPVEQQLSYLAIAIGILFVILAILLW